MARFHNVYGPHGTWGGGRNSDNTKIMESLGWAPSIKLRDGMAKTYAWIDAEYQKMHVAAAV